MTKKQVDERFAALAASLEALSEARRESTHRQDAFAARMEMFANRVDQQAERIDAISERMAKMEQDLSSIKTMVEELLSRKPVAAFASG